MHCVITLCYFCVSFMLSGPVFLFWWRTNKNNAIWRALNSLLAISCLPFWPIQIQLVPLIEEGTALVPFLVMNVFLHRHPCARSEGSTDFHEASLATRCDADSLQNLLASSYFPLTSMVLLHFLPFWIPWQHVSLCCYYILDSSPCEGYNLSRGSIRRVLPSMPPRPISWSC